MSADSKRLAAEQLQAGIALQRSGQWSAATSHYQRAAKLDAQDPQARYLLGVCALHAGQLPLAAKHLRECLRLNPTSAEAHNGLGVVLRRQGDHRAAIDAFLAALAQRAHYVEAQYNLGLSQQAFGAVADAEHAWRQALQWRADDFNSANALGNLLLQQERPAEALPLLEVARRLRPDLAHTQGAFAQALLELGRVREAMEPARRAAAMEPDHAAWWATLGRIERLLHHVGESIAALRRAIALAPQDAVSRCELGLALAEAGEIEESRDILGSTHIGERAQERLRWTVALSLPSVYVDEAQVDAERARFAQGLDEIVADLPLDREEQRLSAYAATGGVSSFHLEYQARDNTELHRRFGALITRVTTAAAPTLAAACAWRARAHGGRIRVGIVSSHLMHHTVSRYFRRLLAGLDRQRFEVHVWYSGEVRDISTAYIEARVDTFVQVNEDARISAERLRAAQLDALIYPEIGMDPRHQVLGSWRLAPVQCALYGHPATTGLANIDYFLSAAALEPADADAHYSERLIRLPALGTLPEPPPAASDGAWLDAYRTATPLALCLQNHLKLPPSFDAVLARIAQATGARISFFVRNTGVAQRFRARIEASFRNHGLDPAQALAFLPSHAHADYLGAVARADLVLDTPGFSGGATSLDAFSVGAAVLTWNGSSARARQTAGMLALMGVTGLVADDESGYVNRAVAVLTDADRRAELRTQIRERQQVLFADNGVVAALEAFLDTATQRVG